MINSRPSGIRILALGRPAAWRMFHRLPGRVPRVGGAGCHRNAGTCCYMMCLPRPRIAGPHGPSFEVMISAPTAPFLRHEARVELLAAVYAARARRAQFGTGPPSRSRPESASTSRDDAAPGVSVVFKQIASRLQGRLRAVPQGLGEGYERLKPATAKVSE